MLEVRNLTVAYGGLKAVQSVDLCVRPGEIVGLIGPNGAGKTSFIDAVSGFTNATGRVLMNGEPIDRKRPHQRARLGLGRTWQGVELFEDLTVVENVRIGIEPVRPWTVLGDALRPHRRKPADSIARVLGDLGLGRHVDSLPSTLSQGQRKLVGVARALVTDPTVLLLDEPAAGLSSSEGQVLGATLRSIVSPAVGLLLVEHDVNLVMSLCDRVYVLDRGRLLASGAPAEIRADERVRDAYLGSGAEAPAPAVLEVEHA